MILKEADDRRRDFKTLEYLLTLDRQDTERQYRIGEQLRNLAAGIRQERDAAHLMKLHYGSSQDWAIIHDLRVEHDGVVAQIDHLLINRLLEFWICESKSVSQGISIDAHGDFTSFYDGKPRGMASPLEQNLRHLKVMQRILDAGVVRLPTRLGFTIRPTLKSLVLISSRARLTRPSVAVEGLDSLIKTDQFDATIRRALDRVGVFELVKLVGPATVADVARQVLALHRPLQQDWARRFPLRRAPTEADAPPIAPLPIAAMPTFARVNLPPTCATCAAAVAPNVARYCRANRERFGGTVYCRACQPPPGAFTARPAAAQARA